MTGRLPHNHGVLMVTHNVDEDQSRLRDDMPHWAQRLRDAGYSTGYFGKWHIERSGDLGKFGWDHYRVNGQSEQTERDYADGPAFKEGYLTGPIGYRDALFYRVVDCEANEIPVWKHVQASLDWLETVRDDNEPWCCCIATDEPHDPFTCRAETYRRYKCAPKPQSPPIDYAEYPRLYGMSAAAFASLAESDRQEAMRCYYASITEIDEQFGRIIASLEGSGRIENTIVVVTSDHGELLGSHGLYFKNISAFEDIYRIPLIVSGPGIVREGEACESRVGLHDLAPTLLELAGVGGMDTGNDSKSFVHLLRGEEENASDAIGYAEYYGTRYFLTQRVYWQGKWKYVFNGFDEDEMYDLDSDPGELRNLCRRPGWDTERERLLAAVWGKIRTTGDRTLEGSHYGPLRIKSLGPDVSKEKLHLG